MLVAQVNERQASMDGETNGGQEATQGAQNTSQQQGQGQQRTQQRSQQEVIGDGSARLSPTISMLTTSNLTRTSSKPRCSAR